MNRVIVIGSGASGVHFALSVLKKGYEVSMLDVGHRRYEMVNPNDSFNELKINLEDPVRYFLGDSFQGVSDPESESEFYGFPPSKDYVFKGVEMFQSKNLGFSPLSSFARGGLAEAWTGGSYPFNDNELSDFPFSYRQIEPFYNEVARRIGISGVDDDLTRFFPYHEAIMEPLRLDDHSGIILEKYEQKKEYFNEKLKWYMGRSRIAVLSRDRGIRKACQYLGRCLWGCPAGSLYTPLITLDECKMYPLFTYIPNMYATHFQFNGSRRITSVVAQSNTGGGQSEFQADRIVLAAGTLSSAKLYLESIFRNTGEKVTLSGLMDNRQILVPFVNVSLIGKPYDPNSYQYHQLSMGLEAEQSKEYVHGQITTLKTAMIHPILQKMPFDLKTSIFIFKNMHAALGLGNINLHDTRRAENYVTLDYDAKKPSSALLINYSPLEREGSIIRKVIKTVKRGLRQLGCFVPPGMIHVRPKGASVHYAGLIPMSREVRSHTVSANCRSHDFKNLYIVDGTTFPFLPAKNITFTLMANAARVAATEF